MDSQDHGIHSFVECVLEGSDYFQQTLGRVHKRKGSSQEKMGATEDQALKIQRISQKR